MAEPLALATLGGAAAAKAIEQLVSDFYGELKAKVGDRIKLAAVNGTMRRLREHAETTRYVKTLWQVDKAVDLLDFYCDSHIVCRIPAQKPNTPAKTVRRKVTSVADFCTSRSVLVQGIAGQGKSILLRYLCSIELRRAERIPLFIELHRIQANETLTDHITRALRILGFHDIDQKLLTQLCETRRLLFFLDGFDEIPEDRRTGLINEIEELDTLSPGQFIISARPDSGIEMSTRLDVERLDNLQRDEYKAVIRKLTDDKRYADTLITRIERHAGRICELLCTPLLVTLLVISYKSYQELPNQLSDFYERIFQDLLQRHDGTKPGFRRIRRCKLNDAQYRQVFDCLCYYAKAVAGRSTKFDVLQKLATTTITKCGFDADAEEYLKDILKVTCLILREGNDCRFIHNSVQEYYSASYVRHRTDAVAKTFYDRCVASESTDLWSQELFYLHEIDPYRYRKFYTLPKMCKVLGSGNDNFPTEVPLADSERTLALIGHVKLGFVEVPAPRRLQMRSLQWSRLLFPSEWLVRQLISLDYVALIDAISAKTLLPEAGRQPRDDERWFVTISEVVNRGIMIAEFNAVTQTILRNAHECIREAIEYIGREDKIDLNIPAI